MKTKLTVTVLAVVMTGWLCIAGCGKKDNPLGPTPPDVAAPTPTPVTAIPGKSTVIVKTVFGNSPLSNVACKIQFANQQEKTGVTDSTGQKSFVEDAEGNFTATIPAQGDILESTLLGYATRGAATSIVFQPAGSISVTPTAINYDYAGGTYHLVVKYQKGAGSLNTKMNLGLLNKPAGWSASFDSAVLTDGQSTILNLTIPNGSSDNAMDFKVRGSAQSGAIAINSSSIPVYRDWVEYADLRVSVQNGSMGMSGINFVVTDAAGQTYTAKTQADGKQIVRVWKTGNYTVFIPAQGYLVDNTRTGTVAQSETKDVVIQVGSADITVMMQHEGTAYKDWPIKVTDANGVVQQKTTDPYGSIGFHLNAIGNYTVSIVPDSLKLIVGGTKTGSIKQNENKTVFFNGQKGALQITNADHTFPSAGGSYSFVITYLRAGDIQYGLNLSIINLSDGSGMTYNMNPKSLSVGSSATCTVTAASNLSLRTLSNLQIRGERGNPLGFQILSSTFTIKAGSYNRR